MKRNAKTTKRALLASVLSIVLCVAMLLGTTFAWFTSSATNNGNRVQAGKLNVKLLMKQSDGSYENISNGSGDIFQEASVAQNSTATLWEPGKTQVVYLAIENSGELALKYQVALNVTNPEGGKDLYKVMQYAIGPDKQAGAAWATGSSVTVGSQIVSGAEDVSLAPGATNYFALLVHMDETAGNEYKNGKVAFDLTVLATQDAVESDSFSSTYDTEASYSVKVPENAAKVGTTDDLEVALKGNKSDIVLTSNLTLNSAVTVASDVNIYSDSGKTITVEKNGKLVVPGGSSLTTYGVVFDGSSEWSTDGAGKIAVSDQQKNNNYHNAITPFIDAQSGSVVTLGEGTVIENVFAQTLIKINNAQVILKGAKICNNIVGSIFANYYNGADIIIEDGTDICGNYTSIDNGNGGLAWIGNGKITMNGGTIRNNYYSGNGLIMVIGIGGNGQFIMNGGTISGNQYADGVNGAADVFYANRSNGRYGLITIHRGADFTMNGGTIENNHVRNYNRAAVDVYPKSDNSVHLNGGTIRGNVADINKGNNEYVALSVSTQPSTGLDAMSNVHVGSGMTIEGSTVEWRYDDKDVGSAIYFTVPLN